MAGRPGPGGAGGGNRHNGGGRTQKRRNQARTRLTQNATSNVELMDAGQSNQLQSQLQQAQQDYLRSTQAAQQIYPGAQEAMAGVERPQFGRIGNEFDTALGTVNELFGGGQAAPYMNPAESSAGMGLGQAYGEAGHTMLANADAREGMFRSSAERQAGLAGQQAQDTLLQRMQDTVQGYNNSMGQLRADDPWQIQNESTRLWEQQQQAKALAAKTQSDAAFSAWLQGQAGGLAAGGGGGGGGGQPGGNGGPGGSQGPHVQTPHGAPGGYSAVGGYGDTAAGGNNFSGPLVKAAVPPAWRNAGSYGNLPPIIQEMYERESGQSMRDVFNGGTPHPSYQGPGAFNDFRSDYRAFLPRVNRMHRRYHEPQYVQPNVTRGGNQ